MKKLAGFLTIGYPRSNDDREVVSIEVKDKLSQHILVHVEIDYLEWARAQSCLAVRPCEVEFYDTAPAGMVREHKTEVVLIPKTVADMGIGPRERAPRREKIAEILKAYEVDGWEARIEDTENHHRWVKERDTNMQAYHVAFERYVDPPAEGQQPKGEE